MTQGEKVALTREEMGRIAALADLACYVRGELARLARRAEDRGGYGGSLWELAELASGLAEDVDTFTTAYEPDHNENAKEG